MIIASPVLFDAFLCVLRRIFYRQKVFEAHCSHYISKVIKNRLESWNSSNPLHDIHNFITNNYDHRKHCKYDLFTNCSIIYWILVRSKSGSSILKTLKDNNFNFQNNDLIYLWIPSKINFMNIFFKTLKSYLIYL